MKMSVLLKDVIDQGIPPEFGDREIVGVCLDSRKAEPGCLFLALPGPRTHGAKFIDEAISRGAQVVIVDRSAEVPLPRGEDVLFVRVDDPQAIVPQLLDRFYHEPTKKIHAVGVTGTNGKTTITYLLEAVFNAAHQKSGVIGTIEHRYAGKKISAKNTTPGIGDNYQLLGEMTAAGASYCFMEVSSHALDQGRVNGIPFKAGIFTNLTGDHLDYHKNMEEYFLAKARLFSSLNPESAAIINIDDSYGPRLKTMTKARVITYGIDQSAMVRAYDVRLSFKGSEFMVASPTGSFSIRTALVGRHNVYNILSVVSFGLFVGLPIPTIQQGVSSLKGVPGRLEPIDVGQNFSVFVDYAHTEDALKNVLASLRNVNPARIIVVFGCGGDRDQTKRPKMGRVASELADDLILTNDNPRSEEPEQIIRQILVGITHSRHQVILDRRQAIEKALSMAKPGDIVLVAGKGHEDYQIFKDKTVDFPERDIVRELLRAGIAADKEKKG